MLRPGTQDTYISRRVNLPTAKSHAKLVSDVEPKIKAQAFFSARVSEAHILDRLRQISDGYSRGEFGLGEARNRLKDFLRAKGYDPHQGGMRNLASTGRLNLILKQNAAMAHSAAEWKRMHDPDAMKVFPYVRYHARSDNRTRSEHAHLDGRIFRKDDPFLSTHTPPWEFNCRCWLEEISEKEAGKTPDLIQEPTPADKVTVDSKSGFSFDPAHAFEKFDFDAIKDPGLQAQAKSGVEQILAGESPTSQTGPTSQTTPAESAEEEKTSFKEIVSLESLAKDGGDHIYIGVSQAEIDLSRELGFDAISRPTTIREVLKEVNPKYKGDSAIDLYSVNCQRAVYAYEARLRGLNVVAKPALNLDISKDQIAQQYHNVMQGQEVSMFNSADRLMKKISDLPDGARAVITVDWDDQQYGHAFIAQKINGKTVLIDPQTGRDASNYLEKAKQNGKFVFSRIDNLRFDAKLLAEVCEARDYENG